MSEQRKGIISFRFVELYTEKQIAGLYHQIKTAQGKLIAEGKTNSQGLTVEISHDVGTELHVYVKNILFQSQLKHKVTHTIQFKKEIVKIISSKILLDDIPLEQHDAPKGTYKRRTYKVKSGDTITSIAKQNHASVIEIISMNQLKDNGNKISVGQIIKVPMPKTKKTASKQSSSSANSTNVSPPLTPISSPTQQASAPSSQIPASPVPTPQPNPISNPISITQQNSAGTGSPVAAISTQGNFCECRQQDLLWGGKVSCAFRKKVIKICQDANIDPNNLMAAMAHETGGTFDPACGTFRDHPYTESSPNGYVGLIQMGKDAATDVGTTRTALVGMTQIQQLDYVEKYITLPRFQGKLNTLTDFYLAVLFPVDVGKGNEPNYIVFNADAPISFHENGTPIKNVNYWRNKGYSANPAFFKEKVNNIPENGTNPHGKTYIWEIAENIQKWADKGAKPENKATSFPCQPYPVNIPQATQIGEVTISLVRKWQTSSSTVSEFSIIGTQITGFILEPKGPDTTVAEQDRRIPIGEYKVEWHHTGKNPPYTKALRLSNQSVSPSRQILMHKGNYPLDTEGCLLPGTARATNFVGSSGAAVKKIHDFIETVDITKVKVVITEAYS